MVTYWRENVVKILMFLDDGFGMNKSLKKCKNDSKFVIRPGLITNKEKSIWEPQALLEWTGLVSNGPEFSVSSPQRRVNDLFTEKECIWKRLPAIARNLARLVGKVISVMPVIWNVARLITRHLYELIQNRVTWDRIFNVSQIFLLETFCTKI